MRSFLSRNCKEAKVLVSTVSYTIKRHLETGGNSDRKRSGRPKATTGGASWPRQASEDKFLRVNSLRDRRLTGQWLQAQLNTGRSKEVCEEKTLSCRFDRSSGSKKAIAKMANKKKRLDWAMKHCQWTTENWKKVLWTNESKFEIFGSSRRVFVRRRWFLGV